MGGQTSTTCKTQQNCFCQRSICTFADYNPAPTRCPLNSTRSFHNGSHLCGWYAETPAALSSVEIKRFFQGPASREECKSKALVTWQFGAVSLGPLLLLLFLRKSVLRSERDKWVEMMEKRLTNQKRLKHDRLVLRRATLAASGECPTVRWFSKVANSIWHRMLWSNSCFSINKYLSYCSFKYLHVQSPLICST